MQFFQGGAAFGFGWMRGKYGRNLGLIKHVLDLLRRDAAIFEFN